MSVSLDKQPKRECTPEHIMTEAEAIAANSRASITVAPESKNPYNHATDPHTLAVVHSDIFETMEHGEISAHKITVTPVSDMPRRVASSSSNEGFFSTHRPNFKGFIIAIILAAFGAFLPSIMDFFLRLATGGDEVEFSFGILALYYIWIASRPLSGLIIFVSFVIAILSLLGFSRKTLKGLFKK